MPYRMQASDTEPWAERLLIEHWRGMEPWQKVEVLDSLEDSLREITLASLAERHPGARDEDLVVLAACRRLGREIVERVRERRPSGGAWTRDSSTSA